LIVIFIALTKRKLRSEAIDKRLKIAIMLTTLPRGILLTNLAIISINASIANMRKITNNRAPRSYLLLNDKFLVK